MSKGRSVDFIGLVGAILEDCSEQYPTLRRGFERDYIRLMSLKDSMGDALFLVHLPAVERLLLRALGSGRLATKGEPLTRPINGRSKIPRLFQGLWLRILSEDGCLKQDIDATDIFFLRSLLGVWKKFEVKCAPKYLYETIKEFYDVEGQLPPPSPIWDTDGAGIFDADLGSLCDLNRHRGVQESLLGNTGPTDDQLLATVQRIADRVAGHIGEYIPDGYRFRHGPGAVSDGRRGEFFKYNFPSWSSRLQHVFPADLYASTSGVLQGDVFGQSGELWLDFEHHSRLIAVPKTATGPRLIAAEPTCHQWAQQNIRAFLDDRIKSTYIGRSIDFTRQDLSGSAARAASLVGDRATMDLKSASDRLSCWLIQRLFRKNPVLLAAMIASRTRYIYNELDATQPSHLKLRKFASMGSALTFPVQSLSFFIICVAAGVSLLPGAKAPTDIELARIAQAVRVYGDDLIVPVTWVPRVRYILERLYLRVNNDKTFATGNFRESCGVDAYRGYDVAPVRVRAMYSESKPGSISSVVDSSNNLWKRGLWRAATWLLATVPLGIRKGVPVVHVASGSFGSASFVGAAATSRKRWNRDLHRVENMSWVVIAQKQTARHEGAANLLQWFTEAPDPGLSNWESGRYAVPTDKVVRRWVPLSAQG